MQALWHVMLISFRADAPEEKREEIYKRYQTFAEECGGKEAGILYFKVERNLDLRKGVQLVELAVFRNNDALQAFRNHPKHKELARDLSQIADWQVGDLYAPWPLQ